MFVCTELLRLFKVQTGGQQMCKPKETVDENGKFLYHTSDMRPVPPGL